MTERIAWMSAAGLPCIAVPAGEDCWHGYVGVLPGHPRYNNRDRSGQLTAKPPPRVWWCDHVEAPDAATCRGECEALAMRLAEEQRSNRGDVPNRQGDDSLIYESRADHRAEGEDAARRIINRMRASFGLPEVSLMKCGGCIWHKIDGQHQPPKEWPAELADAMDGAHSGPEFLVWRHGEPDFDIARWHRGWEKFQTDTGAPLRVFTHWAEIIIPTAENTEG